MKKKTLNQNTFKYPKSDLQSNSDLVNIQLGNNFKIILGTLQVKILQIGNESQEEIVIFQVHLLRQLLAYLQICYCITQWHFFTICYVLCNQNGIYLPLEK